MCKSRTFDLYYRFDTTSLSRLSHYLLRVFTHPAVDQRYLCLVDIDIKR